MSTAKKKVIKKTRKKRALDSSKVVVVMHTVEKETLFPEKLKKVNDMLKNAKMLDS